MKVKSGSQNEKKIVLTPSRGGVESERVRTNAININESSIMTIKVYITSMRYIYLPLVLVCFPFF